MGSYFSDANIIDCRVYMLKKIERRFTFSHYILFYTKCLEIQRFASEPLHEQMECLAPALLVHTPVTAIEALLMDCHTDTSMVEH